MLTRDIEAPKQQYDPDMKWTAESVGHFMRAVPRGAFILARAKQRPGVAAESLTHSRQYLEGPLGQSDDIPTQEGKSMSTTQVKSIPNGMR